MTGPGQIPTPDKLIGPGIEKHGQGELLGFVNTLIWLEFGYEANGSKCMQRWYYVPSSSQSVYLLRAQAKSDLCGKMSEFAGLIASSFQPRP